MAIMKRSEVHRNGDYQNQIITSFLDFIALIHQDWGELETALEYAKRSLDVKEELEMNEALPLVYMHLGIIHVDLGELEAAEDYYHRAFHLNLKRKRLILSCP